MTLKDIEKIYTDRIEERLAAGWHVNLATIHGMQGDERTHIDLTNGKEINRIYIQSGFTENGGAIAVVVGRDTKHVGKCGNIWNSDLELLYRKEFSEIKRPDEFRGDANGWYVTPEEGKRIRHIRRERARLNSGDDYSTEIKDVRYRNIFLRWIRKQPRMKTVRPDDITSIEKAMYEGHTTYYVRCKSKLFRIVLKGE